MNTNRTTANMSIAILTPYARYFGGVEYVNQVLLEMLEREGLSSHLVSQELLGKGAIVTIRKKLFGLNKVLANYFHQHWAATTDVVICNGEFSFGVHHPAAINSFHGCYYGYAQAMRSYVSEKEYCGLMRLAAQQKEGAEGKYVIADSTTLAEVLSQQGIHVDGVIDNVINTDLFRPSENISRNNRCIFVGSADHYGKGFDILEKLVDRGIEIDCVTSTRPRDSRLGWLGNIPNENLPEIYSSYKAFLLPSRFEGCGLVALEAMACGTPIVMTSVGAGPDIAREIPEFVVAGPWEAVPEMIIERLRLIEKQYEALSFKARDYVVRYHGYDDWKRKWLATIEIVLQRARGTQE